MGKLFSLYICFQKVAEDIQIQVEDIAHVKVYLNTDNDFSLS